MDSFSIILRLLVSGFMEFFPDLFLVSFGEIEISPLIVAFMIFLTLFVFSAVLISTTKLIQSFVNDSD